MEKINQVILSLGSNIENRLFFLRSAISKIEEEIGRVNLKSSVYESEALGFDSEISFYNICIEVETVLDPFQLLKKTQEIEIEIGRTTKTVNVYTSRKIDIDIIFFGEEKINSITLQIPHKLYKDRKFVLIPLIEIYKAKKNQESIASMSKLLESCKDQSSIIKSSLSL